jgi:hypothetical protein
VQPGLLLPSQRWIEGLYFRSLSLFLLIASNEDVVAKQNMKVKRRVEKRQGKVKKDPCNFSWDIYGYYCVSALKQKIGWQKQIS